LFEIDRFCLAHEMPFMESVRIVVAENTAIIDTGQMGHEEGKIVENHLIFTIDPNLFAQNSNTTGAPETSFIIGIFAQMAPSTHAESMLQMMHEKQHLDFAPEAQRPPLRVAIAV
jgi:hypothetical protein